jgi:hypothetical protein
MLLMSVRRFAWPVFLCGVVCTVSVTGTVRSQDSEAEPPKPVATDTPPPAPVTTESEARSNAALQAVGGLGVGHIQSTLGLIGVTADAFARDIYDAKKVEELMNGTINGIEAVKKQLRNLGDTNLSDDDEEFINRMIGVYIALEREAKALTVFAKSKKTADAANFAKARKAAVTKLDQLTGSIEERDPVLDPSAGN